MGRGDQQQASGGAELLFERRHRRVSAPELPRICPSAYGGYCDLRAHGPTGRFALTYEPRSVVVVGGIPGSGKAALVSRLRPEARVLNVDELIQERIAAGEDIAEATASSEAQIAEQVVGAQGPVVIVAPAVYQARVRPYLDAADVSGRSAHCLVIDADPGDCRAAWERSGRPPIADDSWRRYQVMMRKRIDRAARENHLHGFASFTVASPEVLERLGRLRFGD